MGTNDDDLKDVYRRAADIASVVPESMQQAAFLRAVDAITGAIAPAKDEPPAKRVARTPAKKQSPPNVKAPEASPADTLVAGINSTNHPEILSTSSWLARSLMVLEAALKDHDIDGLTPPEIQRVLKEKFRLSAGLSTISQALGGAGKYVDRTKEGRAYRYRIMAPGSLYLADLKAGKEPTPAPKAKTTPKKAAKEKKTPGKKNKEGRAPSKKKGAEVSAEKETPAPIAKRGGANTRPGPKALLSRLVDEGYFAQRRTIGDVLKYAAESLAHHYKSTDFGSTLTRLLQERRLKREKNAEGQYEYWS